MKRITGIRIFALMIVVVIACLATSCNAKVPANVDSTSIYGSWSEVGIVELDENNQEVMYSLKEYGEKYNYEYDIKPMELNFDKDGSLDLFERIKLGFTYDKLVEVEEGQYEIHGLVSTVDGKEIDDPLEMITSFILKNNQLYMTMEYRQKGEVIDKSENFMVFEKVSE